MEVKLKTCDTCKWWSDIELYGGVRNCTSKKLNQGGGDDELSAVGYDVYSIETGPKFGCIHHEEKV